MDLKENRITVRELLATAAAREVLRRELPDISGSPLLRMAQNMTLEQVLHLAQGRIPAEKVRRVLEELRRL